MSVLRFVITLVVAVPLFVLVPHDSWPMTALLAAVAIGSGYAGEALVAGRRGQAPAGRPNPLPRTGGGR